MATPRASSSAAPAAAGNRDPFAQWPLLIVLVGLAVGLVIALVGSWRFGATLMGSAVLVGALERLVIPQSRVGLLRVRSRFFDVVMLAGIGIGTVAMAILVRQPQ